MRFNRDNSVNIEETYSGDIRFSEQEYIYLWNLFEKEDEALFRDLREIIGLDPVEEFLNIASIEFYESRKNLK